MVEGRLMVSVSYRRVSYSRLTDHLGEGLVLEKCDALFLMEVDEAVKIPTNKIFSSFCRYRRVRRSLWRNSS